MVERKIAAMHKRFGIDDFHQCKECDHLIGGEYRGRRYYKCELYGMTHSVATDWRLRYQACGLFNLEVLGFNGKNTVLEVIKHQSRKQPERPIEGQCTFDFEVEA